MPYTESNRTAEFPYNTRGTNDLAGAKVYGYSNISSNRLTAAYSNVSFPAEDPHKHYSASSADAKLNYNANYAADRSQETQLGINALNVSGSTADISTVGVYDVTKLATASKADYILCEIELFQKDKTSDLSYTQMDDISDYISAFSICDDEAGTVLYRDDYAETTNESEETIRTATSSNKYVFILKKSKVDESLANGVYSIPIEFTAYTGPNASFEQQGLQYGNYRVKLTVSLLTKYTLTNGALSVTRLDDSEDNDFVVYTNARISTDRIKVS